MFMVKLGFSATSEAINGCNKNHCVANEMIQVDNNPMSRNNELWAHQSEQSICVKPHSMLGFVLGELSPLSFWRVIQGMTACDDFMRYVELG